MRSFLRATKVLETVHAGVAAAAPETKYLRQRATILVVAGKGCVD